MARQKLGELLLDEYEITDYQLEEALEIQKKDNKRIGIILVEIGAIDGKTLSKFLIRQTEGRMNELSTGKKNKDGS